MKFPFRELPSIPYPAPVAMSKGDLKIRDRRINYGKPVRQLTTHNQSTKDNVGALPLYACTAPDPLPDDCPADVVSGGILLDIASGRRFTHLFFFFFFLFPLKLQDTELTESLNSCTALFFLQYSTCQEYGRNFSYSFLICRI